MLLIQIARPRYNTERHKTFVEHSSKKENRVCGRQRRFKRFSAHLYPSRSLFLSGLCKHFPSFIKPPSFHGSGSPPPFTDFFRRGAQLSSASKSHWSLRESICKTDGRVLQHRGGRASSACQNTLLTKRTKRGGRNIFSPDTPRDPRVSRETYVRLVRALPIDFVRNSKPRTLDLKVGTCLSS